MDLRVFFSTTNQTGENVRGDVIKGTNIIFWRENILKFKCLSACKHKLVWNSSGTQKDYYPDNQKLQNFTWNIVGPYKNATVWSTRLYFIIGRYYAGIR